MNEKLMERIVRKEALAILTGTDGSVIWESGKSPVSALCREWFTGQLPKDGYGSLYADQLGVALAMFAVRLGVPVCYARKLSEYGYQELKRQHIEVQYEAMIPLVHSSKEASKVCPIEQFLVDHPDETKRWDFLKSRSAEGPACSLAARHKAEN
ncbi:MAG: DUF1893 domain-containing protein [Clostridiales bacterium]|uniref:DUF1893 domain-containing protein n=1 Tax=Flavonifractor porci TaxID=3133422 RepID=UPI0030B1B178|nr:DUF1893 domain-containing protein [Clostridiales bacterium]